VPSDGIAMHLNFDPAATGALFVFIPVGLVSSVVMHDASHIVIIFAEITSRRIRRGRYVSVDDLADSIDDYRVQHNTSPCPSSGPNQPRTCSPASATR